MTSNPFSENPKYCYIEFPQWDWLNHNLHTKYDDFYIPAVPPYRSYENDKPLNKTIADWLKSPTKESFSESKDALKFHLELAGFAKEHVSVSIEGGKNLKVSAKNKMLSYSNNFLIPNAENYNLANPTAQMENGLLEISFAAKKEEVRTIKIL
jgi:HSP20 family molecular chaperone IbpA